MRTGTTISGIGHALVLGWCLVSFSAKPFDMVPMDMVNADIISDADFSKMTAGSKAAPKVTKPQPVVDRLGERKEPPKDLMAKAVDKPPVQVSAAAPPPPSPPSPPQVKPEPKPPAKPPAPKPPEAKPPEAKPSEAKPSEAKAEPKPKPAEAKPVTPAPSEAKADPKPDTKPPPDPIAEALKREEVKQKEEAKKLEEAKRRDEAKKREEAKKQDDAKKLEEAKKQDDAKKLEEAKKQDDAKKLEEAKKQEEVKRQDEAKKQEQKFDLAKIETALLDKRAPQRQMVTGSMVNPTASLGAATANAPELSRSEIDALRSQLYACWNPPVGVLDAKDLIVTVRFSLNRDGSLSGVPTVVNRSGNALFQVAAESATRAVQRCQPFRLPAAKYDAWQEVEVNFRPEDMFRG